MVQKGVSRDRDGGSSGEVPRGPYQELKAAVVQHQEPGEVGRALQEEDLIVLLLSGAVQGQLHLRDGQAGLVQQLDNVGSPGTLGTAAGTALHLTEEDLSLEMRRGIEVLLGNAVLGAVAIFAQLEVDPLWVLQLAVGCDAPIGPLHPLQQMSLGILWQLLALHLGSQRGVSVDEEVLAREGDAGQALCALEDECCWPGAVIIPWRDGHIQHGDRGLGPLDAEDVHFMAG